MRNPLFMNYEDAQGASRSREGVATYSGIGLKTLFMTLVSFVVAAITFVAIYKTENMNLFVLILIVGAIVSFVCVIAERFTISKYPAIFYCMSEGAVLGALSLIFELIIPGIVVSALGVTMLALVVSLLLYMTPAFRLKNTVNRILICMALMLLLFFISMMVIYFVPAFYSRIDSFALMITVDLFCLVYSCIFLMASLKEADVAVVNQYPKKYEWTYAFGLAFAVLYIYLNVLELIADLSARRK